MQIISSADYSSTLNRLKFSPLIFLDCLGFIFILFGFNSLSNMTILTTGSIFLISPRSVCTYIAQTINFTFLWIIQKYWLHFSANKFELVHASLGYINLKNIALYATSKKQSHCLQFPRDYSCCIWSIMLRGRVKYWLKNKRWRLSRTYLKTLWEFVYLNNRRVHYFCVRSNSIRGSPILPSPFFSDISHMLAAVCRKFGASNTACIFSLGRVDIFSIFWHTIRLYFRVWTILENFILTFSIPTIPIVVWRVNWMRNYRLFRQCH